jgi:hypothetical protein
MVKVLCGSKRKKSPDVHADAISEEENAARRLDAIERCPSAGGH